MRSLLVCLTLLAVAAAHKETAESALKRAAEELAAEDRAAMVAGATSGRAFRAAKTTPL